MQLQRQDGGFSGGGAVISAIQAAYARLREGTVARTIQVTDSILVDLDGRDRILGVETLSGEDWTSALATLAMTGRLAIPDRGDLWP